MEGATGGWAHVAELEKRDGDHREEVRPRDAPHLQRGRRGEARSGRIVG